MVVLFSCQCCSICCLANRRGDPLGVSGLESILVVLHSLWTGPSGCTQAYGIHQQMALFLVTHTVSLNLANSIKCVGDSCSYPSYACSLLCAPGMIHTCTMWPICNPSYMYIVYNDWPMVLTWPTNNTDMGTHEITDTPFCILQSFLPQDWTLYMFWTACLHHTLVYYLWGEVTLCVCGGCHMA